MGNQEGSNFEKDFNDSYSFIQLVDDPNYGLVKVYRKKMVNYDYVMVYQESLMDFNEEQIRQLEGNLRRITEEPHQQLLKLHYYRIVQETNMTCTNRYLRLFVEYYNFSLQNLIDSNHKAKIYLSLDEILYILNSAVAVAKYFRCIRVDWFNISTSQVFLAPSGCIYFSPARISKSSNVLNICGGCTLLPKPKYENILPVSSGKDLKGQLSKLLKQIIGQEPKEASSQYQPLFRTIETAKNIYEITLPPAGCSAIDMMRQIYKLDDKKAKNSRLSPVRNDQSRSTSRPYSNQTNMMLGPTNQTNRKGNNTQSRLFLRTR